jgi:hypothetical protein
MKTNTGGSRSEKPLRPGNHGGPEEFDSQPGKLFFLAVERQSVHKLGHLDSLSVLFELVVEGMLGNDFADSIQPCSDRCLATFGYDLTSTRNDWPRNVSQKEWNCRA